MKFLARIRHIFPRCAVFEGRIGIFSSACFASSADMKFFARIRHIFSRCAVFEGRIGIFSSACFASAADMKFLARICHSCVDSPFSFSEWQMR